MPKLQDTDEVTRDPRPNAGSISSSTESAQPARFVTAKPQIDSLTSLRFFAAAAIVLYHTSCCIQPYNSWFGSKPLNQGVSFFFLLSGFILTYVYPELKDKQSVLRFYIARVARIWPTHAWVCVLTIIWSGMSLTAEPLAILGTFAMVQSALPFKYYFTYLNPPSWSVSTELFFYLCFPLLISQLKKRALAVVLIVTGLLAGTLILSSMIFHTMYVENMEEFWMIYVNPIPRLFEFTIGITLCLALQKPHIASFFRKNSTVLTFCIIPLLWFAMSTPDIANILHFPRTLKFWFGYTGGVFPYAAIILIAAVQSGWFGKILANKLLVRLGHISYGMYLYHIPLYLLITQHLHQQISGPTTYVIYWASLLALSDLTFQLLEGPARDFLNTALGAITKTATGQSKLKISFAQRLNKTLRSPLVLAEIALIIVVCVNVQNIEQRFIALAPKATASQASASAVPGTPRPPKSSQE